MSTVIAIMSNTKSFTHTGILFLIDVAENQRSSAETLQRTTHTVNCNFRSAKHHLVRLEGNVCRGFAGGAVAAVMPGDTTGRLHRGAAEPFVSRQRGANAGPDVYRSSLCCLPCSLCAGINLSEQAGPAGRLWLGHSPPVCKIPVNTRGGVGGTHQVPSVLLIVAQYQFSIPIIF